MASLTIPQLVMGVALGVIIGGLVLEAIAYLLPPWSDDQ